MRRLLEGFANRRRVRRCVRRLGPTLRRRHGIGPFSSGQVYEAARAHGLDEVSVALAYTLWCAPDELDRMAEDPIAAVKLRIARTAVGQMRLAQRDAAILVGVLGAAGLVGGGFGGEHGGGFEGGGFDGGGFDGGGGGA